MSGGQIYPPPLMQFELLLFAFLVTDQNKTFPSISKSNCLWKILLVKDKTSTFWHVCAVLTLLHQFLWTKKFFATANQKKTLSSLVARSIRVIVYLGIWGSVYNDKWSLLRLYMHTSSRNLKFPFLTSKIDKNCQNILRVPKS